MNKEKHLEVGLICREKTTNTIVKIIKITTHRVIVWEGVNKIYSGDSFTHELQFHNEFDIIRNF